MFGRLELLFRAGMSSGLTSLSMARCVQVQLEESVIGACGSFRIG